MKFFYFSSGKLFGLMLVFLIMRVFLLAQAEVFMIYKGKMHYFDINWLIKEISFA
jgi:hypothetical protein